MRDNELIIIIRAALVSMMPTRIPEAVLVKQNFNPVTVGRDSQSTVYVTHLFDRRLGQRGSTAKTIDDKKIRTEITSLETTFQFNALASQRDPANDTELTASDILKAAAAVLQSENFLAIANENKFGVQRISDIRPAPFQNDRGLWETQPTFDVVISHSDIFTEEIPEVTKINSGIEGI